MLRKMSRNSGRVSRRFIIALKIDYLKTRNSKLEYMNKKHFGIILILIGFVLIWFAILNTINFAGFCEKGIKYYVSFVIGISCIIVSIIIGTVGKNKILKIILIALVLLASYYFLLPCSSSSNLIMRLESVKIIACRDYIIQNPACNNAALVTFQYPTGNDTNLVDFTNIYYGCSNTVTDQFCARRVCGCPGY